MTEACKQILMTQYQIAIELYKHEDELNWKKLNHFFYITAALLGLIGLVGKGEFSESISWISPYKFTVVVCFAGVLMSIGFSVALIYGVKYMHNRRDKAKVIEKKLLDIGGGHVLLEKDQKEQHYLKKSPTNIVLIFLPVLFTLIWGIGIVLVNCRAL